MTQERLYELATRGIVHMIIKKQDELKKEDKEWKKEILQMNIEYYTKEYMEILDLKENYTIAGLKA